MSQTAVVFTEDAGEPQQFAGEELRKFLSQCDPGSDISVSMHLDPAFDEGEFTIGGRSGNYRITAGSDGGLLYGAYELLRQLGFRFFGPDPWDTVIPSGRIALPELQVHVKPKFELRGFFAVEKRDTDEFLLWMARNGLNLWTCQVKNPGLCRKLGMKLRGSSPSGTHRIFADFLPPEKYAAEHPEWYALHEGRRLFDNQDWGNSWNICMANEEGVRQLCENIAEALNPGGALENVSVLTFAPFDGGNWCECEACRAMGNRTTRILKTADCCSKTIRQRVKRPVQLIVPAYHETLPAPDGVLGDDFDYDRIAIEFFPIERCYAHRIDDPACPANAMLRKYYEAWVKTSPGKSRTFKMSIGEYYNVSTFASAAFVFDDSIPHDLEYYHRTGAKFMDYMHVSTALWGELALTNYAFAETVSGRKFDLTDFLSRRYGPAAEVMRQCYECLRIFTRISKPLFHYVGTGQMKPDGSGTIIFSLEQALRFLPENRPFFLPGHFENDRTGSSDVPSITEALQALHRAQELLNSAKAGNDERVRQCLETDRMRLDATVRRADMMLTFAHLIQAERAGQQDLARETALKLRDLGEAMREDTISIAHIRAEGAPNLALYTNALTATRLQERYAEKMKEYGLAVRPFSPEEGVRVEQG